MMARMMAMLMVHLFFERWLGLKTNKNTKTQRYWAQEKNHDDNI
jgi:hypothetical protein